MPARRLRTTVALPKDLLEAVDVLVREGETESRTDFLERALRHELAVFRRAVIDAEFAQMKSDAAFQAEAMETAESFAETDWEAWRAAEADEVVLKPKPTPRLKTLADAARFMQENFPDARDFPDREQPTEAQVRELDLE